MKNEFTLTVTIHAKAETIYKAWLSTQGHSAITGSPAKVDGTANGDFTAWDGYIWGTFLELEENKRIAQTWRTSEFPDEAEDSIVEILLEELATGLDRSEKSARSTLRQAQDGARPPAHTMTTLTLKHSNIPEDQAENYKQGWEDFYFKPMKEYFGGK
jgi:activator of HSP90 ATPase